MTKVNIISGFLGAGKTTLIKKLLNGAFEGEKVVLLENEYGEVGIDGGFMKDSGIQVTEINSGCICCTLVGDMEAVLKRARAAGKLVCADSTKPKNGETIRDVAGALANLDFFFPNSEEARLLANAETDEKAAKRFVDAGVKNAVIKRGRAGCLIANDAGRIAVPAYETHCMDTTGAGDTFAAAFQAAILEGRTLAECGAFACAAASICVENLGATEAMLDRGEIERRAGQILNRAE